MSLWNLLTVALATSTIVIGHYAYTQTGPQGPKGPQGESFAIDLVQNLTDCSDFSSVSDQYPYASPSQLILWLVETDSRPSTVGCPSVYDLAENDVTANDFTGHVLMYNGDTWFDHGMFNAIIGPDGPDGRSILNGSGAPSNGIGNNGDYYMDTDTTTVYGPKASGVWPSGQLLIGPQGSTGADGTDANGILSGSGAPSNGLGINGDFYMDAAASNVYGPKATGTWPGATSLKGSTAFAPIYATLTTADSYDSTGSTPMKFNSAALTSGTWTQGGTGNITWTCATSGTYEMETLVEFKCTSFTAEFYPEIRLMLVSPSTNLLTSVGKLNATSIRTTGKIRLIRAFAASDAVQLVVVPSGPSGTDTIQVTDSTFTIKRVV
jgi:hypothetical protein